MFGEKKKRILKQLAVSIATIYFLEGLCKFTKL
jgi:hypothetical protein